jgi:hypothetical protein
MTDFLFNTVGYSTIAFNLIVPPSASFDLSTLNTLDPCYGGHPPFPDLDGQASNRVLQLNRLTVAIDEGCIGGKGIGAIFVRFDATPTLIPIMLMLMPILF